MSLLLRHQFCFTTAADPLVFPSHFTKWLLQGYRLATEPSLPVIPLVTSQGKTIGYILGWAILDTQLLVEQITLPFDDNSINNHLEPWLYQLSGRWVAIIVSDDTQRVYMDVLASQSTIYQQQTRRLASTPALIDAKADLLLTSKQLVNNHLWYPAGCTAYAGVKRLLANHYLCLKRFQAVRHWPLENTAIPVSEQWHSNVPKVANIMQQQLLACAKQMPLRIGLTAGMESRVMLACSREVDPAPLFWTRSDKTESQYQDTKTASVLAKRFNLAHTILAFKSMFNCNQAEIDRFMANTGYCVGGSPLKSHKLIDSVGPCFAFTGIGGEIARAYYYPAEDNDSKILKAQQLLQLAGLPALPQFIAAMQVYIAGLPNLVWHQQLALFYLENRVSAFGAVHRYGYQSGIVLLSPFSHRYIVQTMLSMPLEAQRQGQLHRALIQHCWPELNTVAFNTPLDIKDWLHFMYQRVSARLLKR